MSDGTNTSEMAELKPAFPSTTPDGISPSSTNEEKKVKPGPKSVKEAITKKPISKPTHPTAVAMVEAAIGNLKERSGSSLMAIKKYIATNYKVDVIRLNTHIKKALANGVEKKTLVRVKGKGANGSFKLGKSEKKDKLKKIAKKPKVAKAKKPKVAKAKKPKKVKKETTPKSTTKPKSKKPKESNAKKPKKEKKQSAAKVAAKPKAEKKSLKKLTKSPKPKKASGTKPVAKNASPKKVAPKKAVTKKVTKSPSKITNKKEAKKQETKKATKVASPKKVSKVVKAKKAAKKEAPKKN